MHHVMGFNIREFMDDLVATGMSKEDAKVAARKEWTKRRATQVKSRKANGEKRAVLGSSAKNVA